uniref:Orotate phosphoribosyltransferase n=2 Tax=environmental samples TaxID=651140 RepID=A0A075HDS2_9ARCH|nr:orotate phosphoribosyltransferase (pyrE) [uncultured marine thaumarchaeote KM3_16_C11]AIF12028.1 orotate phosphoribosyltransferase (pyrE) [uncultured marine thaumarchaeote KM3_54_C03]
MEFVKEFAIFLHQNDIIKFGDFTLASGKKSSYYIDLRLVASFPHIFRKMIKNLQKLVSEKTGFDNFDSLVSVPTGGLIIGSALAIETVKPLIYVRNKPKDYGTTKSIEGKIFSGMKVILVDDVITTGNSVINGIKQLKDAGLSISDVYVIINRLEGANNALELEEVNLYQLTDVLEITTILFQEKLVSKEILDKINNQINQN